MTKKQKILFSILIIVDLALLGLIVMFIAGPALGSLNFAILNPKGVIASEQRRLIISSVLIMLVLVVPVYFAIFYIANKYRAKNNSAEHDPDAEQNPKLQWVLWGLPCAIILVISVINWKSTHRLDPYRPIESDTKPITIQVVALQWKWLFIYPEQGIATINYIQFPKDTPVNFRLTSDDAPMNSFWIPQLGGQMYAMAAMETQLHLMANETGEFRGSAAEISGAGFAGMNFTAKATSEADFESWVQSVKNLPTQLDSEEYKKVLQPSSGHPQTYYSSVEPGMFNDIIMKYMVPMEH